MKKYFYRPHCGGLKEAMDEHRFFDSMEKMVNYVIDDWNSWAAEHITIDDVSIKLYSEKPDRRIGWNYTFIILVQGCGHAFFTDSYDEDWEDVYKKYYINFT